MATNGTMLVTAGGKERIEATSRLYKEAFKNDPVFAYMLPNRTDEQRHEYYYTYFTKLLKASALNDGIFEEIDNFACATVILPPGKKVDNALTLIPAGLPGLLIQNGLRSCYRMLVEFGSKTDAAKKKGLGKQKYWYLFFIATRPDLEGRGLGSTCLKAVQDRAARDSLPLWIEATTERSYRLYEKNGCRLVEKIMLGKGHVGLDGKPQERGEGVPLWAMVWFPQVVDGNNLMETK